MNEWTIDEEKLNKIKSVSNFNLDLGFIIRFSLLRCTELNLKTNQKEAVEIKSIDEILYKFFYK